MFVYLLATVATLCAAILVEDEDVSMLFAIVGIMMLSVHLFSVYAPIQVQKIVYCSIMVLAAITSGTMIAVAAYEYQNDIATAYLAALVSALALSVYLLMREENVFPPDEKPYQV